MGVSSDRRQRLARMAQAKRERMPSVAKQPADLDPASRRSPQMCESSTPRNIWREGQDWILMPALVFHEPDHRLQAGQSIGPVPEDRIGGRVDEHSVRLPRASGSRNVSPSTVDPQWRCATVESWRLWLCQPEDSTSATAVDDHLLPSHLPANIRTSSRNSGIDDLWGPMIESSAKPRVRLRQLSPSPRHKPHSDPKGLCLPRDSVNMGCAVCCLQHMICL